jgi:serine/threonine protein kinase
MQFTIEEKIQESNFTCVYRAFDAVLQRRVLLKVLHKHQAADPDLRQRFIREAQACAALRSEHIVQVYDLTEYEDCPAIVMEFVEGTSLKKLIADGGTRSLKYTQKVALHTLRGLVTAHEQGIIHRDIKPGNILAATNGTFKVSDFGLAYIAFVPTVTTQGMVLGTPAYMSPEQIRHDKVDERTDLFSLGATLIEVLSGERIFEGHSYAECAKKILTFKPEILDRYADQSSAEFVQILKLQMAPKKQNRFPSSKDALYTLDKKDSDIFINISKPHSQFKNSIRVAISVTILVILAAISYFLLNKNSGSSPAVQIQALGHVDSVSRSTTLVNGSEIEKEVPFRNANDLMRKQVEIQPTANPPVAINQAVVDSGSVMLTSTPWAKVYVDNRLIGETPFSKPLILSAGKHSVLFVHPSFEPIMQTVTVLPFREITVTGNFIENAGYLNCIVTPWAEVYINDQYKDTTPLEKPIVLSPGSYHVRFKNASFADIIREVTIRPKDTTLIVISFKGQQ